MKLVIHAHALRNEPLSQAITGHFDERGGTIGRSDTNTLALPDPERHVSRLQAEVLFSGQAFSIRNVGSANALELNGRTLKPGQGAPLLPGDQLVIGGYAMRIEADVQPASGPISATPRADSRTVIRASAGEARTDPPALASRPRAAAPGVAAAGLAQRAAAAAPSASDPFADLLGAGGSTPSSAADPFADLLSAPPVAAPGARVNLSPQAPASPGAKATVSAAPAVRTHPPDEFDPFADLAPRPPADSDLAGFMAAPAPAVAQAPAAPRSNPDSGLDDLLGLSGAGAGSAAGGSGLDALFGLGDKNALDDFLAPPQPGPGASSGDSLDGFFGKPASPAAPPRSAAFNHTPELAGAYSPPTVRAPPAAAPAARLPAPAPAPPAARAARAPAPAEARPVPGANRVAASPAPAGSVDALWQAFCEGAGLSLSLPQGLNPQLMRVIGQVLHDAVDGTLKLVAARAASKQELRAQVTTIQSKHNNPLKFSVDTPSALAQLLQPPMRGFMQGPDAVREVMDDLLGHHIGTMTGTRAALQGMLKRFEPALLESRLAGNSVLDSVLPMNRRARLWELYVEHFKRVQEDAQDDFHELFGKAFVKAYEEQLDLLVAARGPAQ